MNRTRRAILATASAVIAAGVTATGALAEPKTNLMHQWAQGSEAAAIAKLGEMFTAAGGLWEQTAISGHTSNTLAKLRSDVVSGNAPPAVQLKGPRSRNGTRRAGRPISTRSPRPKGGMRWWRPS